jgi:hypothetical protein
VVVVGTAPPACITMAPATGIFPSVTTPVTVKVSGSEPVEALTLAIDEVVDALDEEDEDALALAPPAPADGSGSEEHAPAVAAPIAADASSEASAREDHMRRA